MSTGNASDNYCKGVILKTNENHKMPTRTRKHEIKKQTVPKWNNCGVAAQNCVGLAGFCLLGVKTWGVGIVSWSTLISPSLLKCDKTATLKCCSLKMQKENSSSITFIWNPRTARGDMGSWGKEYVVYGRIQMPKPRRKFTFRRG